MFEGCDRHTDLVQELLCPCARGSSWCAAVQASFKLSGYPGTGPSEVTVTVRRMELLSDELLLFEEDFPNNFGIGIELGKRRGGC